MTARKKTATRKKPVAKKTVRKRTVKKTTVRVKRLPPVNRHERAPFDAAIGEYRDTVVECQSGDLWPAKALGRNDTYVTATMPSHISYVWRDEHGRLLARFGCQGTATAEWWASAAGTKRIAAAVRGICNRVPNDALTAHAVAYVRATIEYGRAYLDATATLKKAVRS